MTIPPGAFSDCEKLETPHMLRPDGKPAPAFKARAGSLAAMRSAVIDQDTRIKALEESVAAIPFPFGVPS